jgi:hypothetical protein
MQKCGARTSCLIKEVWQQMWLPGRGSKGVVQETASWKKGVATDVAPGRGCKSVAQELVA